MFNLELPFWLSGLELTKLKQAAQTWWTLAEQWLRFPLNQFDPLTCPLPILDLLAYQRDIKRFFAEPENLYRLRVKLAFVNAQDSGGKKGFKAIFKRLGLGNLTTIERFYPVDWDVVILVLSDAVFTENQNLISYLIEKYGRTCRRYEIQISANIDLALGCVGYECLNDFTIAGIKLESHLLIFNTSYDHHKERTVASLKHGMNVYLNNTSYSHESNYSIATL
jgi:hypothetical protein